MIFVGDIASPNELTSLQLRDFFKENSVIFNGKRLICNFEGLLNDNMIVRNEPVLYNHPSILTILKERGEVFAGLANNHILDLAQNFEITLEAFNDYGIDFTGAGKSRNEADKPAIFYEGDKEIVVFNACWDFLLYNHKNPSKDVHIAIINEEKLIDSVSQMRMKNSAATIVVYLHWNFDLETIPFPMHRQFSQSLIDKGADLVVGTHSHCVQGGEKYKNGYIVYGLGNFFVPHREFANGKLSFPTLSDVELVLEWDNKTRMAVCHWFKYTLVGVLHKLSYIGSAGFETCPRLKACSVYQEMSEKDYILFFRKNRRKRILIPVYRNFEHKNINKLFTKWLKGRARIARFLAKLNFHKWQN